MNNQDRIREWCAQMSKSAGLIERLENKENMKEKIITVYLPPNFSESDGSIRLTRSKCRDSGPEAKLIIEVPERKIEITESEFDVIFRSEYVAAGSDPIKMANNMKQKLFGE